MGGGEINVAYEGTFGDLGSTGDAALFGMNHNFDWEALDSSTDSLPMNEFTAINNSNGATISPKDVLLNDGSGSVPPSTSFTNLTTPGSTLLQTPDEGYEASPLFNNDLGFDSQGTDKWFSLFPDSSGDHMPATPAAPGMTRTTSTSSANQIVVHPGGESYRKRSSTATSPTFNAVKPSTVAGVGARKRDKPLPPIMVDEHDPVALKRARNTAAARKSRDKKVQEREAFLSEIADLKAEIEHWKALAMARRVDNE